MAHVARAAVDAMAYQTRDVLEVMQEEAGLDADDAEGRWRSGGQRDAAAVPGRPARRARCGGRSSRETTALGAAYLAGLAVGYWEGLDDVRRNWALDREFAPQMAAERRASGSTPAGRRRSSDRWRGRSDYGLMRRQRRTGQARGIGRSVGDQRKAFLTTFFAWVLDAFDFTILTFVLVNIQQSFSVNAALAGRSAP